MKALKKVLVRPTETGREALLRWRVKNDLPQADAAEVLEVSRQTVFNLETGRYKPGVAIRVRLRDLAGIGLTDWEKGETP